MDRRTLLAQTLLAAPAALAAQMASAPSPTLLKPPALKPGDTVGLISPSTYVVDPDQLNLMRLTAQMFGLNVKVGKQVGQRDPRPGSSAPDRVADLHAMFSDPEVKGILCVRGGYGSQQMLGALDFDLIKRHPKVLLGYSDITALHLAIHKMTGLVTFHGPTGLSPMTDYSQNWIKRAWTPEPMGTLGNPRENNPYRPRHPLRTIRPGKARGR
ncbi:MAG: LD-carboxypeptidase, partial [Bryobacter sp.]|nr:LD-carboxypeptidase [Bryobacter sp.]